MSKRQKINRFIDGTNNVICDTCGTKRKAFQCTLQMIKEMPNVMVCTDTCLDEHNPQMDVHGVPDRQVAPIVRPDSDSNAPDLGAFTDGYTAPLTANNLRTNGVK